MTIGINTNLSGAALRGIYSMQQLNTAIDQSTAKILTGNKIQHASDNPYGLATAMDLQADITSAQTQLDSNQETINQLNPVDDALGSIIQHLQDMDTLVTQWENAAAGSQERTDIENSLQDLSDMIDDIAGDTQFKGEAVLAGDAGAKTIRWGEASGNTTAITFTDMRESNTDLNNGAANFNAALLADSDGVQTKINNAITDATNMSAAIGRVSNYFLSSQNDFLNANIASMSDYLNSLTKTDTVEESVRLANLQSMRTSALQALGLQNSLTRNSTVDLFG